MTPTTPDLFDYLLREHPGETDLQAALVIMHDGLVKNPVSTFTYEGTGFMLRFVNGDQASFGQRPIAEMAQSPYIEVTSRPAKERQPPGRHFQPVTGPDAPPPAGR